MNSAALVAQVALASAKLQELQNPVMASSRPPSLHQLSQASGNPGPSIASISNAAQCLPLSSLSASKYSLLRMASGSGTPGNPASSSKNMPGYPGPK